MFPGRLAADLCSDAEHAVQVVLLNYYASKLLLLLGPAGLGCPLREMKLLISHPTTL